MPKIDITEPEFILITSALEIRSMEMADAGLSAEGLILNALRMELHHRFARARVLEETKDPD